VLPYLGLSMSFHYTAQFLTQAFSEEVLKLKREFLDPRYPALRPAAARLGERAENRSTVAPKARDREVNPGE